MSTQEELADTIAVALRGEDQFGYTDISDLSDAVLDGRYDLLAVADAVLADYQRKPRTAVNFADLEALPHESVIRDALGDVYEKWSPPDESKTEWMTTGTSWTPAPTLPVTVIFIPEATA